MKKKSNHPLAFLKPGFSFKKGGPIDTPYGQWQYPGEVTRIPSNRITMQGVNYPVLGVDNTGYKQMMLPGGEYNFPGTSVTEYPIKAQTGLLVPPPGMFDRGVQRTDATRATVPLSKERLAAQINRNQRLMAQERARMAAKGDFSYENQPTTAAGQIMNQLGQGSEAITDLYGNLLGLDPEYLRRTHDYSGFVGRGLANLPTVVAADLMFPYGAEALSNVYRTVDQGIGKAANYLGPKIMGLEPYVNPNYAAKTLARENPLLLNETVKDAVKYGKGDYLPQYPVTGAAIGLGSGMGQVMYQGDPFDRSKLRQINNKINRKEKLTQEEQQYLDGHEKFLKDRGDMMLGNIAAGTLFGTALGLGARNRSILNHFNFYKPNYLERELANLPYQAPERYAALQEARNAFWAPTGSTNSRYLDLAERKLIQNYGVGRAGDYIPAPEENYFLVDPPTPPTTSLSTKDTQDFYDWLANLPQKERDEISRELYTRSSWDDETRAAHTEYLNNLKATREERLNDLRIGNEDYFAGINISRNDIPNIISRISNRNPPTISPISTPNVVNRSGFNKTTILNKLNAQDQEAVAKMSNEEFANTILKPTGELGTYEPGKLISGIEPMTSQQYTEAFNSRLDLLNDIIAQNNKSGITYGVKELTPEGKLIFETPEQVIQSSGRTIPKGTSEWTVNLKPGQWRGEVEDIANTEYLKGIPGIEMSISSSGVFPLQSNLKGTPGTKAYESINQYLKRLDLGRVKPGFNSQTESFYDPAGNIIRTGSKDVWESFIKSGKAVGFYNNPKTVYGSMKAVLPYAIPTAAGVSAAGSLQNLKDDISMQKKGGSWMPNSNPYKYSERMRINELNRMAYGGSGDNITVYPAVMDNGGISDPYFPNPQGNYTNQRLNNFINLVKGSAQKAMVKELEKSMYEPDPEVDIPMLGYAMGGPTPYQNGLTAGSGWLARSGGSTPYLPMAQAGTGLVNDPEDITEDITISEEDIFNEKQKKKTQKKMERNTRRAMNLFNNRSFYDYVPNTGSAMNPYTFDTRRNRRVIDKFNKNSTNVQFDDYGNLVAGDINAEISKVRRSGNFDLKLTHPSGVAGVNEQKQPQISGLKNAGPDWSSSWSSNSGYNLSQDPAATKIQEQKPPTMDPNQQRAPASTVTEPNSVTLKARRKSRNGLLGNPDMWNVGMDAITGFANRIEANRQEAQNRIKTSADYMYEPIAGSRGDYTPNYGYFRPDQMVPVQYYGAAGSRNYEYGGSANDGIYMSDQEIQEILANGGEIEYLD